MSRYISGEKKDAKSAKSSSFGVIDEKVIAWFHAARSRKVTVTGAILQAKALEVAKSLDLKEFKASNGWLARFQARHNILNKKLRGESAEVSQTVVDDWKTERLPMVCHGFRPEDIFNADETGLFYRQLRSESLVQKGEDCRGAKLLKERLTVLLACSKTGEKLKPLVIGKAAKPRCFRNLDTRRLSVKWCWNKKAWMSSVLFKEWLHDLNQRMIKQKRQILLLIDNAPTHPQNLAYSNVTVRFFPKNTTSKLQPLDQGIIWSFKSQFKRRLATHIVNAVESAAENKMATDLCKTVNVLDAVNWITEAWSSITTKTIGNCFREAGFSSDEVYDGNEEDNDENRIPLRQLMERAERANVCEVDDIEKTIALEETMQIHEGSGESWQETIMDTDANDEDQDADVEQPKPTPTRGEAAAAFEIIKRFCVDTGMTDSYNRIAACQSAHNRDLLFTMPAARQTPLDAWTCNRDIL